MKNNKGITLIALVITIIVLLILAAVTISGIVKRNSVIDKAHTAKSETARQREEEEKLADGKIIVDDKEYDSLDDYMDGKVSEPPQEEEEAFIEVHNWIREGDTLTCTCSDCTGVRKSGKTLTIGQKVNYTEINGHASTTITAEKSGYTTDQTVNKGNNTEWLVLGIEDSNNNGTNETLLLITKTNTQGIITLRGDAGYNNWLTEADRMAEELYGKGARSVTMEDINNCINYKPLISNTLVSEQENWSIIKSNGTHTPNPNDEDSEENLGNCVLNAYSYDIRETNATIEEKNALEGTSNYWLASQAIKIDSEKNRVVFGCARRYAGEYTFTVLSNSSSGWDGWEAPLRAVVSVRNRIPEVVEDGDEEEPAVGQR